MRINDHPVSLHVDNCPAFRLCFVEAFVEAAKAGFSVVGPFALGIGVVDVERESRPLSGSGPLQHLQVTVAVAERGNGSPADLLLDGNRLAFLVVIEVELGPADKNRRALAHLELHLDTAANHLLRWDAVNFLGPRAHELDAAAGYDEGFEIVCTQVIEQLQHGLIDHLGVGAFGRGMSFCRDPAIDDCLELRGGHTGVSGHKVQPIHRESSVTNELFKAVNTEH